MEIRTKHVDRLRGRPRAPQGHEIGAKQHDKEAPMKSTDVVLAVLYWGGPPLGVQNLYTCPTPKTGIKQIEQFNMSPGLRKKAQDAQDAALRFLTFPVSVALTRRLRFLRVLRFSVYSAIYKMNRGFEIFEVFSFNRTDKAFEIFYPRGTRDTIILLEGVPKQVATKGPAIIPPKALRSALLVACVRSLEGRREGSPKTNNASKDQNKTEQCDAQS